MKTLRRRRALQITVVRTHPVIRFSSSDLIRTAETVYRGERVRNAAVTIVLTTSRYIRRVNRQFLRHDRPTDVIAFPLSDASGAEDEVYVNMEYARRQAGEYGVTLRDEVRRLVIHGCLHLLGYRDQRSADRQAMREREDHYLRLLVKAKV